MTTKLRPPPPPFRPDVGGDDWVEVCSLEDAVVLDALLAALETAGIETRTLAMPVEHGEAVRARGDVPPSETPMLFIVLVRRSAERSARGVVGAILRGSPGARRVSVGWTFVVAALLAVVLLVSAVREPHLPGAAGCERGNLGGATFRGLVVPCHPEAAAG